MNELVYPEYRHRSGIRFGIHPDGSVTARLKDEQGEIIATFTCKDTEKPYIPAHKNFNGLCRQMFNDGDVDHIITRKQDRDQHNRRIRKAAPAMLEALQNLENDNGAIPDHAWRMVQNAIAQATGESA